MDRAIVIVIGSQPRPTVVLRDTTAQAQRAAAAIFMMADPIAVSVIGSDGEWRYVALPFPTPGQIREKARSAA